ncbi:MAG: hypothetical protein A2X08_08955 [Bacteroidetes bacterium GWA2_32_17]|nr:MAG: hypothetical protein A2X08_08955 [Bacteroidetes bacterium GWA2_32_17]
MKNKFFFTALFFAIFWTESFAQWISQTSGTIQNLNSIFATTNSSVFTVGTSGTGRKTSDGGAIWNTMSLGVTTTQYSLRFINSTSGFTAGGFQDILQTSNSGSSWTNIGGGMTDLYDCYFTSFSSGWVVGDIEVGYGFLYNPFTFNLIQISANANKVLRGIYFANSTIGWVLGDGGLIIKTINSGTNWTQQTSGTTNQLNKIMFIDANNGIVVGNTGTILKTINGGTNWTLSTSGTTLNLNALYYADALNIWTCGDNGIILKSIDGGLTWFIETSGTIENLNAIHGIGITDIWACGNNGTIIYHSGTTSVFENQLQTNISVYPNPTNGDLRITINDKWLKNAELKIFDAFGKNVYQSKILNLKSLILNLNLPNGIYFLQVKGNNFLQTKKLEVIK